MLKTRRKFIHSVFFKCCFLLAVFCLAAEAKADDLSREIRNLEDFSTVYQVIKHKYIKERDSRDLIKSAIAGMVRSLDPYSDILSASELETFEMQSVGRFVGIGITVNQIEGRNIVTQVYKNSPAANAGIEAGDEITTVDNVLLADVTYQELQVLLKGEIGSNVTIEIRPGGENNKQKTVSIRRSMVKTNSVECTPFSKDIAIYTLHQFEKHSARDLADCMKKKKSPVVILDLRSNPGGLLISAVEVAELFLDIGEIVQIRDRNNNVVERYISRRSKSNDQPRLYLLINRFSASSAEILAGAIRDRKRGILIGERSFGKGVVQSIFPIGDDLYIKITTALYYTPSEVSFEGVGIEPDIPVQDVISARRYSDQDSAFQKALEMVRKE